MWFAGGLDNELTLRICKSTVVPGATLASAASAFGILNARLLPHFRTLVFIFALRPNIRIYIEYTTALPLVVNHHATDVLLPAELVLPPCFCSNSAIVCLARLNTGR